MRLKTVTAILLVCAATGFAQDRMADALRKGILEEDSKQNPAAAIQQYQVVLSQYAEAHETAANALFRMAECYRKQGNKPQAIASYRRFLKEFADQTKLAQQSRGVLENIYTVAATGTPKNTSSPNEKAEFDKLMDGQKQELAKLTDARARYRTTIQAEMDHVKNQISRHNPNSAQGQEIIDGLQIQLIRLQRDLAAFDAGMTSPPSR